MRPISMLVGAILLAACASESAATHTSHVVRRPEPEFDPFERAIQAAEAHEWSAALDWLRQAEAEHPEQVELARERVVHGRWIERGELCDFEWLERRLHVQLEDDPREPTSWAELARLHLDRAVRDDDPSALRKAALILVDADRLGEPSAELELVRGLHAQLEDRHADAIAAWQRAVDLDPALAEARLRLGIACLEHRDHARAEVVLVEYVELEPEDAEGWLALGVAHAHTHAPELARAAYQRAAELAPEDPRPHWNLAWLYDEHLWGWEELSVRQRHLSDLLTVARRNPLADCEAVPQPDPQCVVRVEARRKLLIEANAEIDRLERELASASEWPHELRRLQESVEVAEKDRRKRLLEMEAAHNEAPGPTEASVIEPIQPRRSPVEFEVLTEPPGLPCGIR